MKKATITFITTAALACAIPLFAAGEPGVKSDSQRQEGVTQQQSGQMITAEKLKGMEVISQKGEELGEIEEVMIDQQSGEVKFVTISKGGIFGLGGERVAAPLSAFEISDIEAKLTVDQSKLENVPQQKAEATDSDYQRDLETHYGVAPAWGRGNQGDATQTQQMNQSPTEPRKVDTQN